MKYNLSDRQIAISRVVLGLVFVISGFAKSADAWGSALKLNEYFTAFGTDWMSPAANLLAIVMNVAELALGLCLIFNLWKKAASLLTMLMMIFFTLLTLVIAIWNPVDDCGCFGDALKLNNWMTFAKNIVLLPLSIIVWRAARRGGKCQFGFKGIIPVLFIAIAAGINIYTLKYLPLFDSSEFRKGVDLRKDVLCSACIENSVVLVYEDIATGEQQEFDVTDTTWYDTSRWRYVTTRTAYDNLPEELQQYDFSLIQDEKDIASDIVYYPGTNYILLVRGENLWRDKCRDDMADFVARIANKNDLQIIFAIGTDSGETTGGEIDLNGTEITRVGMDKKLMSRILRSDAGVLIIKDGMITGKYSCSSLDKMKIE